MFEMQSNSTIITPNNDLLNEYRSITNQISKIYHYKNGFILEEINSNTIYITNLFNILIEDTPFNNFIRIFKSDYLNVIEAITKLLNDNSKKIDDFVSNSLTEKLKKPKKINNEIKSIAKCQNQMIDVSFSKIIRKLLSTFKHNLILKNDESNIQMGIFLVIEESIKELPLLILSNSINDSHESSIAEIKQFICEIIIEDKIERNFINASEIWLLLYTRIGGLDNILQWFGLVIDRCIVGDNILIRTDIISNVIESLFIGDGKMTLEIKDHLTDCLNIDILDQETIRLYDGINCIFLGILRAFKINLSNNYNNNNEQETDRDKSDTKNPIFKDIYFWEHGDEKQTIKPAYPDSLSTRLNSSSENPSVKQVICCQSELIMVNNLGQVRSRTILKNPENLTKLLNPCWSPIHFPEINYKIDHISVGWTRDGENQHFLALSQYGQVYSWGSGQFGKLGHGDTLNRNHPTLIEDLRGYNIKKVSCGTHHSSCVSETGLSFLWGNAVNFNGKENEISLAPKRLQHGLMSNIICGPNSTFLLSINKRNIYYMGSKYNDQRLYTNDFILEAYPTIIEGLPFAHYDRNEKIKKVALNSMGIVVLLNNGELYSVGHGLIIGCPNCKVHKIFERVKLMLEINVLDIAVSATHVVVLSQNVVYSWSLTVNVLVLVQESFDHCLTSISAVSLIDNNKKINIAWNHNSVNSTKQLNCFISNKNPYLSLLSLSDTMEYFNNILINSYNMFTISQSHESTIINTLKLFLQCLRANQLDNLSVTNDSYKIKIDNFIKTILIIGDHEDIDEKIKKIICTIINESCHIFYNSCEAKADYICEIISNKLNPKPLRSLSFCTQYLLKNLLNSFNDESQEIAFVRLSQLCLPKLDDLLITICQASSDHTISVLQGKMSNNRPLYTNDSFNDLCTIIYEFTTIGYRIFISLIRKQDEHPYSPVKNLCYVLQLTNSIIGCFKLYIKQINKSQKIISWIKTNGTEINLLLSRSPMSWIMFDILIYMINQEKYDMLLLLPHLSRLITSLDSINVILPKTKTNNVQEIHWSLYGFSGCPNISNTVPEPGSSWLWLLDLERLSGLVIGILYKRVISPSIYNSDGDNGKLFSKWLKTPIFQYIQTLPVYKTNQNNRYQPLILDYNNLLKIIMKADREKYFLWSQSNLLYSTGLHIYTIIIYLSNNKFTTTSVQSLKDSFSIYNIMWKVMTSLERYLTSYLKINLLSHEIKMTKVQEDDLRNYITILNIKCNFLISFFNDSLKTQKKISIMKEKTKSIWMDDFNELLFHKPTHEDHHLSRSNSLTVLDEKNFSKSFNEELMKFLKDVQQSLESFLVTENIMDIIPENLIETTTIYLQELSSKMFSEKKSNKQISEIFLSFHGLLDDSILSIDSVFIQILNSILISQPYAMVQIQSCHIEILEKIFSCLMVKLKNYIIQDNQKTISQRMCVSIINFLSSFSGEHINLMYILIDGNFLDYIIRLSIDQPFISNEKWLIIEGNGDKNLPNVCNVIRWCIFENFILNLSICKETVSEIRMMSIELQLRSFVMQMYNEIAEGNTAKIFDLYSTIKVVDNLFNKSNDFKKCVSIVEWIDILLNISTNLSHLQEAKIFPSKYALNLAAINFLFSIVLFEGAEIKETLIAEIFHRFSEFFYFLMTKSSKFEVIKLIRSLDCRINIYKHFSDDFDTFENSIKYEWILGNCNFDKQNSYKCKFVTSDKISVSTCCHPNHFLAINCEDLAGGIWRVTLDVECQENSIDFTYGFIENKKDEWPKDHVSLMKLVKQNPTLSASCRSTVDHRFNCIIDIDHCFIYFSNGNNIIQSFVNVDGVYRFFVSSFKNHSSSFQIQIISIKQLSGSELKQDFGFYNNTILSPNHYGLLESLYCGFNNYFAINTEWMYQHVTGLFVRKCDCLKEFDLYFDKNISSPTINQSIMFALFLLSNPLVGHGFYLGEICKFSYQENVKTTVDMGLILGIKVKGTNRLKGLNFLEKLTKTSDIQCIICSLSSKKQFLKPLSNIQKHDKMVESVFLKTLKDKSYDDCIINLIKALFNCTNINYFDVDITNYEGKEWSTNISDRSKVEFHFIKSLCSRLMMQILSKRVIIDMYITCEDDKMMKIFQKIYSTILNLASKPCPLKKKIKLKDFPESSYRLVDSFYQIYCENEIGLVKKYAYLFMDKNDPLDLRGYLDETEQKILLRSLEKQTFGRPWIDNFINQSKNNIHPMECRSVSFRDRRRKMEDHKNRMQLLQNQSPAEEYDLHVTDLSGIQETEAILSIHTFNDIPLEDHSQRSMDDFVLRSINKSRKRIICPICESLIKNQQQQLFSHLSIRHPLNCRKTFLHHASNRINADGSITNLDNITIFCASISDSGYFVCKEYLENKFPNYILPTLIETFNKFSNDTYFENNLIGWSGTLTNEHYCYQKISDISISDDIRPKLDQTKILGHHIHQEINYCKIKLDSINNEKYITNDSFIQEIAFICIMNCGAIIKALHRLEYSCLVLSSRKLIVKLTKIIFQKQTRSDAIALTRQLFLTDFVFVMNIIRLVEADQIEFIKKHDSRNNNVRHIQFTNSDFLSILLLGLESTLISNEQIHQFIDLYILNLENFLTSNKDFFILNTNYDAAIFIRPSALLIQLLFNTVMKLLFSSQCNTNIYQYWQIEVEQIMELLSFGFISNITISKVKIWCLRNLLEMFQLISGQNLPSNYELINMVDLCEDMSLVDSPSIHVANCNSTVKKLISVTNKRSILTADCEGTMRLWDIDLLVGTDQNLKQTFLFSIGDEFFKDSSSKQENPEIIEKCLRVAEPLRVDLSNYLIQIGIQKIAISPTGFYLAESLGVYLNIWSTKSFYSKPYIASFTSLITSLNFPRQTYSGILGCPVELLLVALAHGDLIVLRIFDNGTRVTQHPISGLTEIPSNVTTVAWDEEKNFIAVGYHDGSIVLTDQKSEKLILEMVHSNRILLLLYCSHPTQYAKNLLASSSVDEDKIAIWNVDKLLCVIIVSAPVSCLEWLPKPFTINDNNYVLLVGTTTGLIQFWKIDKFGNSIENLMTFTGHLSSILKLKLCENTNLLASGCNNGWINVWSIRDRSLISTCRGDGCVVGLEWTTQNNLVAAFSRSEFIKIWRYFNNNSLQKNGIRQWAHIRKIFIQSTKTKSIKHLKNLKLLSVSLHKILDEQFLEEIEFLKSGYSIVCSQYFQTLIQFVSCLNLIPKFCPCFIIEPLDIENHCHSSNIFRLNQDTYRQRSSLLHHLNLNDSALLTHQFDWLYSIDEMMMVTKCIYFDDEVTPNIIPRWWWIWCIGSDEYAHHYIKAKWKNHDWSMDKQIELYQWYRNYPYQWIKEYFDSTFIWGRGIKGELGILSNSDWEKPLLIKIGGIQQIVCGSGVTMIITCEGKLMACGEGLEIIFNPFMREEPYRLINVPVLNDYKVSFVAASRGPESHIIAITSFGEVFSWGIGSYGKLGHGHATTLKKPKLIETLRGKNAVMADCGHMHSAVVTSTGELYTFGLGASGQLGIEILSGCDTPRLVNFEDNHIKVGFVACGMNHTLALSTDGLKLFAFGEGAYGKLGVGDFKDYFSPKQVELKKKSLIKVACGKYFSMALTSNGEVLTWGRAGFVGISLPNSDLAIITDNHILLPFSNAFLESIGIIIDISAGNKTSYAVTTTGQLYGWGSNKNNVLRQGTKLHVNEPVHISFSKDIHVKQISCGSHHVATSSHAPNLYRNNIPTGPQLNHNCTNESPMMQYVSLHCSDLNIYDMTARLILILYWNELVRLTWQFWMPQTNQHFDISHYDSNNYRYRLPSLNAWPIINPSQVMLSQSNWTWRPFDHFKKDELRQLVNNEFVESVMYRYLNGSMVNNRAYNSLVRIDRINKPEPVFIQTCRQVLKMDSVDLRLPWRAWKVKLVNEGADDAGGAYDETISEICNELESEDISPRILIPVFSDKSTFIPNPDNNIPIEYFYFLGILMATAIRTKKPIDLHLDPFFWKRMTKSVVTIEDLLRIDPAYFNSLLSMSDLKNIENSNLDEIYSIDKFVCFSANEKETEIIYNGSKRSIDDSNISDFVHGCIYYRLHEFDKSIEHIRKGFCSIAPMVLLDLISWRQMEKMVCGSISISIDILKSIARYVDADESDIIFSWFWEILESFNDFEKSLFLRFVTGKSRLPSQDSHIPFRLFIYISKQPVDSLPQSQTCFNQIRLPRYSSRLDMEKRIRIAINQCRSIDMDDYMLIRNREQ